MTTPKTILYTSSASPYGRKTRIVRLLKSLAQEVELNFVLPWEDPPQLLAAHTAGKVPTLVSPIGSFVDSRVICSYLDFVGQGVSLWPFDPLERFKEETRVAEADAIMDAAILIVLESRRPVHQQDFPKIESRQKPRIERILSAVVPKTLPKELKNEHLKMADIAFASALAYLDLRIPDFGWRNKLPAWANFFDQVEKLTAFSESKLF